MREKNAIVLLLFALGFISLGAQIILIREFLKVFGGNELVAGIVLSTWMLLTATGAWLGRYRPLASKKWRSLLIPITLLALFPVFIPIELAWLRVSLFMPGVAIGMVEMLAITAFVLFPFSLLNGALYTKLGYALWGESKGTPPATAYTAESLGAVVAGGAVNFLLVVLFDAYLSLLLISACFLLLVAMAALLGSPVRMAVFTGFMALALIVGLVWVDARTLPVNLRFPEQRVISRVETPYGEVVVTFGDHQLNFYENGLPLFSTGNVISNEEHAHFALSQQRKRSSILVIAGGYSGILPEILKHNPRSIDYVELNPALSNITGRYFYHVLPSLVTIHNMDPRRFIQTTTKRYDVVLVNMPEPSSLQLNRFYTTEFLSQLQHVLNPGAVVSYSLPTSNDYVSYNAAKLNGTLFSTLKSHFAHVIIAPASRNFFIASSKPLPGNYLRELEQKAIQTEYVNRYYFSADQMEERAAGLMDAMKGPTMRNHDYHPVAFFYQTNYLLSLLDTHPILLYLIFAAIFILVIFTLNPVGVAIFTGGFTASSMQVMLLVALQINLGNMFQQTGLVILASMCGVAAGSWLSGRIAIFKPLPLFQMLQLLFAAYAFLLPLLLLFIGDHLLPEWVALSIIAGMALLSGIFIGLEFGIGAAIQQGGAALSNAKNYPADLFGAAFGALLFTLFMFPFAGLVWSGTILTLLNLASAALLYIRQKFFVTL